MAAISALISCLVLYFVLDVVFGEVKVLNDDSFEHLTQASTGATTGDWLVLFSKPAEQCEKCKAAEELLDKVQDRLKVKMNVAKVLPVRSKLTIKRFGISEWPTVLFLKQGVQFINQDNELTEEKIVEFAEGGYNRAVKKSVPEPVTKFDVMLEDITGDFQHVLRLRKNAAFIIFLMGVVFGLCLTPVLTCIANYLVNTFMDESDTSEEEQLTAFQEKQIPPREKEEDDDKAKRE